MQIVSQDADSQYNHNWKAVSKWCQNRGAWITLPEFREYHPFNIDNNDFSQPYLDEEQHDLCEPDWRKEREDKNWGL
jgi:hypothetical protein